MRSRRTKLGLGTLAAMAAGALMFAASGMGGGVGASGEDDRAAASAKRAKLTLIDTEYGEILADRKGFALSLFTKEEGSKSRCYGECAEAWPPLNTKRKPRAGAGLDSGLLGRTERRNGRKQVTYDGHPLYYYVGDRDPGEVFCQDVREFGGRWYVVTADGEPVL
ncbi:MAG: COG4315 family predicted lipoprotein [Solirubrobacterales bacterium]